MGSITIPYNFTPRSYQRELYAALDSGYKRAITVWHRRAGKDRALWNLIVKRAISHKGLYYYFFPEGTQARKAIWEGIDPNPNSYLCGKSFLDHIPNEIMSKEPNNTDMKVNFINGSILQLIGTDKYDRVRGTNPAGCVYSEFGDQNPGAWEVVRPILTENGGWAVFNGTPKGKNHFYRLLEKNKDNPKWFSQIITVLDSLDPEGNRYISDEMIQEERDSGMEESMIEQEYYCSFIANTGGYYYLSYINSLEENGFVGDYPYLPMYPVDVWFDIGYTDSTAIWFTQSIEGSYRIIDFMQGNSQGIEPYIEQILAKPYIYGTWNLPHDSKKHEAGTGKTALRIVEELAPKNTRVNPLPKLGLQMGINAVRAILPSCRFNEETTDPGISALINYHRKYDEVHKEFSRDPVHDWSSHPADAFRYFATGIQYVHSYRPRAPRANRRKRLKGSRNSWMVA